MALEYEVRAEYQSLSLAQLLDSTVKCFEGVGDTQHDILHRYFGIDTVRQLANMPFFLWALGIQEMALQGGDTSAMPVSELAQREALKFAVRETDQGKNPVELLNAAVNVLDGLAPGQNLALYDAFRVTNVIQLAHNRIMLEARVIEYLEKHPELVQAEAPADKQQIASILGADTFVPTTGEEAQEALSGEKEDGGLQQMAGEIGDHVRSRIDAVKERAAERARDISSRDSASGEELTEGIDSYREATQGAGGSRLDSIRQVRERTESTRVQSVSGRVEEGTAGQSAAGAEGATPEQPAAGAEGAMAGAGAGDATAEGAPPTTIRPPITEEGAAAADALGAELAEGETPAEGEMAPGAGAEEAPPERAFKPWMAAAAAVALIVIIVLIWALYPAEQPAPPPVAEQAPVPAEQPAPAVQQPPQPPPPPPGPPIRTIHTVVKGQSLWRISRFHYKNPLLWPQIYKVNDDQIEDPDLIYPKQKFKIPEPQ